MGGRVLDLSDHVRIELTIEAVPVRRLALEGCVSKRPENGVIAYRLVDPCTRVVSKAGPGVVRRIDDDPQRDGPGLDVLHAGQQPLKRVENG